MTTSALDGSQRVIALDFEFRPIEGVEGNPLEVICGVFKDIKSGLSVRLWQEELLPKSSYWLLRLLL